MNIEHPINGQIQATSKSQHSSPGAEGSGQFSQKYPFPQDSPYFNNNLLLSKLYSERVSRNPHLKHDPS